MYEPVRQDLPLNPIDPSYNDDGCYHQNKQEESSRDANNDESHIQSLLLVE